MPTPLTGSARCRSGTWYARVTYDRGRRIEITLTTCREGDEQKANERAALLAELAVKLRKAGHADAAPGLLERAGARDGRALEDVVGAIDRICAGEAAPPVSAGMTFKDFAEQWTSGALSRRWPDHVKKKQSVAADRGRLETYVYPVIGAVPLAEVSLDHAHRVMSELPPRLSPASRRHVAQVMARVLKLAAYPARLIPTSPIPAGFLPSPGKRKALTFLYPEEDRALLACEAVPLPHRVLYGFLAREGLRRGEAAALTWGDLDLDRGGIRLDANKTDDPRAWALDPSVALALRGWLVLRAGKRDRVPAGELVFVDEAGESVAVTADQKQAVRLRAHLRAAGVDRPELFEKSEVRQPVRLHDLRATFVTIALANGRTEAWVCDRTGHRSSAMVAKYRRAARQLSELGLGELAPLCDAVRELREALPEPPPEPSGPEAEQGRHQGQFQTEPSRTGVSKGSKGSERNGLGFSGSSRTRTWSQWIKSALASPHGAAFAGILGHFADPNTPDRDRVSLIRTASALIGGGSPRARLLRLLSVLEGELAAEGDLAAARAVHALVGQLLGAPAAGEGAEVVDLGERRGR